MRKIAILSFIMILLGFSLFFISAATGNGGFALFLIFPVFYSSGILGVLGFILIFGGFILLFFSPFMIEHPHHIAEQIEESGETHYGGVILIGPIPIVFGSDKNHALYAVIGAILMLISIAVILLIL